MNEVYDLATTIEISLYWGKEDSANDKNFKKSGGATKASEKTVKDDSMISWGKARKGEGDMYCKNDRCMKCGKNGWPLP